MANSYPLSQVANELNNIMARIFIQYEQKLEEVADRTTQKVAEDFARKLIQATPRSNADTEHMADTVMVTEVKQKSYGKTTRARFVHYGKWQLSHLLEFGWTSKNGKRITRQPYVRPLFEANKNLYYNMYKEAIEHA